MSSSDLHKPEHTYQSGETARICTCGSKQDEKDKTVSLTANHSMQNVHVHVHTAPKTSQQQQKPSCDCHEAQSSETAPPGRKLEADDRIEVSPSPPALPPRPPPRPRFDPGLRRQITTNPSGGGIRKYVFWCCSCGGLATALGAMFLAVHFLLRSYTSSLEYFETIPTFVPATMLLLTGLCVIILARRKNRYSYLIKVCGLCCLVCALTCVLVTITTTVIHMNRLQTLRECVYTQKTKTCTCYSVLLEAHANTDDAMRFVFESTPDCEVIHGSLYSCLRALFGLSVSGILVCIFSCMLVYQLLTHEKKKMYWEQLELRCRSLYTQTPSTHSSIRAPPTSYCSCCEDCRYPPPQTFPWEPERFWAPGRIGNFYSPNPGEEATLPRQRGWNWRLPWTRSSNLQPNVSSDSQYGFSARTEAPSSGYSVLDRVPGGVYVWGPPPPYSDPNSPARRALNPSQYHIHHHCQERRCPKNYENTEPQNERERECSSDTSSCQRIPHTLPVRKAKKRIDGSSVKAVPGQSRPGVQAVFPEPAFLPRLQGVENAAFQKQEPKPETTESEVYFADVSSCCTVRNDSFDEAKEEEFRKRRIPEGFDLARDQSSTSLSTIQTPLTETTDDAASPDCFKYFGDFLAPDAQYEVIPEESFSNLTNTISTATGMDFYKGDYIKNKKLASISTLIQNLREESKDGLDSGWQSGSEKNDKSEK